MTVDRAVRRWCVEFVPAILNEIVMVVDNVERSDLVHWLLTIVTERCDLNDRHHAVTTALERSPHGPLVLGSE